MSKIQLKNFVEKMTFYGSAPCFMTFMLAHSSFMASKL